MSEYFTKTFDVNSEHKIDRFLESCEKPGYGTSVVGYAANHHWLFITVKRWKLRELSVHAMGYAPVERKTIDEIHEEPAIQTEEEP